MIVHNIYRNQKNKSSRLISAGIGALMVQYPDLVMNTPFRRSKLSSRISEIFEYCEGTVKAYREKGEKLDAKQQAGILIDTEFGKKLGFQIEFAQQAPNETLEDMLRMGVLLQATTANYSVIFGKTASKYWRFDPQLTDQYSALGIYKDENEFKEALSKLKKPEHDTEFCFLKTTPLIPKLENVVEENKIKAKL